MTGMEAFGALDLRVGRITSAEPLAGARKPAGCTRCAVDYGATWTQPASTFVS